ncbi:unnamed protein product [Discula destructiva]
MQFKGNTQFDPTRDIPSLEGKVIFVTGGTSGLGAESVKALAVHKPEHIYFTGRNASAAKSIIEQVQLQNPDVTLTFIELDMTSLSSVKDAMQQGFTHAQLHILICNAGIMATPAELTKDGIEKQFGVNHLAHALIIRQLSPVLLRTAEAPDSDVRIVSLTSLGWNIHPKEGIAFEQLRTGQESLGGSWVRYGQSKLANILYAAEFARRHPSVTSVSVHPGVVATELVANLNVVKKAIVYAANWARGTMFLAPEQGAYNQLWAAAGVKKADISNGSFYVPIGVESSHTLDDVAKDPALAEKLWNWTEDTLGEY